RGRDGSSRRSWSICRARGPPILATIPSSLPMLTAFTLSSKSSACIPSSDSSDQGVLTMTTWRGVFSAVTPKLRQAGSIDRKAPQGSLDRLIANGVSGVIVLPMLGENASLTAAEREQVIRAAKEVVAGRVPLLSGLATISTDDATASARRFESFGAEGLMVFPSIAYKTDPRQTAQWYKAIAEACGIPIMIYNIPIAYGVDVTPAILRDLVNVPGIVCIKEESGDIRRVTDLYNEHGDRFQVFCGVDDLLLESV